MNGNIFFSVLHENENLENDCQMARFSWKRGRVFDELACSVIHANCVEPTAFAKVTSVNSRPKSKWRPCALETVELEKLGSRKLHMNAKQTMKIAEKLYTQGFSLFFVLIFYKHLNKFSFNFL